MGYLDKAGLEHLWGKISAALMKKQDAASAVTMEQVNKAIETAFSAAGNAGTGGSGQVLYSEEEQIVGRWVDNRPLYRKTVEEKEVYFSGKTSIRLINMQDCKIHRWYGYIDDGYYQIPLSCNASEINLESQLGTERFILTCVEEFGQTLMLYSGFNISMNHVTVVFTIEYTKNADQPVGRAGGEAT